jgi:hypothetical protein
LKELREINKELKIISANMYEQSSDDDMTDFEEYDSVDKGNIFEEYVRSLFEEKYFNVKSWTTDICRKREEFVESDCDPDIVIQIL